MRREVLSGELSLADAVTTSLKVVARSCALNDWTKAILWLTAGLVFFFLGAVVLIPGVFY